MSLTDQDDIRIGWSRATVPTKINIKKESSGPQMLIAQPAFLPWSHCLAPVVPIRQPRELTCTRSSHRNNARPANMCDWSPNLRFSPLCECGPLTPSMPALPESSWTSTPVPRDRMWNWHPAVKRREGWYTVLWDWNGEMLVKKIWSRMFQRALKTRWVSKEQSH